MNLDGKLIPLFILRTCEQRKNTYDELVISIPSLIESFDNFHEHSNSSMMNMRRALLIAIEKKQAAVFLEDDIILCENFMSKVLQEIEKHPNDLIQFFSMRKEDLTIGSRYIAGYRYLMNQCFYAPLDIIQKIIDCFEEFEDTRTDNRIGGTDSLIQFCLKKNRLKYWNVVPNLVDHKVGISAIDKRRSSKRQSFTFNGKNL